MPAESIARSLLFAAALLLGTSTKAATISFVDLTEGTPTLTTDLTGLTFTLASEEMRATVTLTSGLIAPGTRSLVLLERAGEPNGPYSDYLTLVAGPVVANTQLLSFVFQSDGAVGFDAAVRALVAAGAPTLAETGASQDVSSILNTNPNLTVTITSDINPAEDAPEPGTLLLLGVGLLASAASRFRARRVTNNLLRRC